MVADWLPISFGESISTSLYALANVVFIINSSSSGMYRLRSTPHPLIIVPSSHGYAHSSWLCSGCRMMPFPPEVTGSERLMTDPDHHLENWEHTPDAHGNHGAP